MLYLRPFIISRNISKKLRKYFYKKFWKKIKNKTNQNVQHFWQGRKEHGKYNISKVHGKIADKYYWHFSSSTFLWSWDCYFPQPWPWLHRPPEDVPSAPRHCKPIIAIEGFTTIYHYLGCASTKPERIAWSILAPREEQIDFQYPLLFSTEGTCRNSY